MPGLNSILRIIFGLCFIFFIIIFFFYIIHILSVITKGEDEDGNKIRLDLLGPLKVAAFFFAKLMSLEKRGENILLIVLTTISAAGVFTGYQYMFVQNHDIGSLWEDYSYTDIYPGKIVKYYGNNKSTETPVSITIKRDSDGYVPVEYCEYGGVAVTYEGDPIANTWAPNLVNYTVEIDDESCFKELTILDNHPGVPPLWESYNSSNQASGTSGSRPSRNPIYSSNKYVWVTENGSKYHKNANCSNMKNPDEVSLKAAEDMGKTRCSKCW